MIISNLNIHNDRSFESNGRRFSGFWMTLHQIGSRCYHETCTNTLTTYTTICFRQPICFSLVISKFQSCTLKQLQGICMCACAIGFRRHCSDSNCSLSTDLACAESDVTLSNKNQNLSLSASITTGYYGKCECVRLRMGTESVQKCSPCCTSFAVES